MPTTKKPRSGTMQFWPRKRSKREVARVRSWVDSKEPKLLGFAGYKAGMTQVIITDNSKTSMTKGQELVLPVTVIECPPLKTASVVFYKKTPYGKKTVSQVFADKLDKELGRKLTIPKTKKKIEDIKPEDFDDLRLVVYTQPKLTNIGKKKPAMFEMAVGGKKEEKLAFVKENLGKEIPVNESLAEGQLLESHSITKGKGLQGPVKRMGVSIRGRKSEKIKRGPANLGAWTGNKSWTVAHAGQTGYHQRVEYNKWLIKIGNKPEEINPKGGFVNYGVVKNSYILLKGSIAGAKKRLIRVNPCTRPNHLVPKEAPEIVNVNLESKQRL